jgi:hypothetical protein
MTPTDWAVLIATILGIVSTLLMALRWFIRTDFMSQVRDEIRDIVREEIKVVKHELTNNGGSSTKDKIDFIYGKLKGE